MKDNDCNVQIDTEVCDECSVPSTEEIIPAASDSLRNEKTDEDKSVNTVFVLGLLAVILSGPVIGIVLGLIALFQAKKYRNNCTENLPPKVRAGTIMGRIGFIVGIVNTVLAVIICLILCISVPIFIGIAAALFAFLNEHFRYEFD